MDERVIYAGMFREELSQQLLDQCVLIVNDCFRPLFELCEDKVDGTVVFKQCVETVRTAWGESDFQQEAMRLPVESETALRGAFLAYVRQTNVDPTGQSVVDVRVQLPPTLSFVREFLRSFSLDHGVQNGSFFRDADRLVQKDIVMKCIRDAFCILAKEYVYVPPPGQAAEPEEHDDVEADDSVSACQVRGQAAADPPATASSPTSPEHPASPAPPATPPSAPTVAPTSITVNLKDAPHLEDAPHQDRKKEKSRSSIASKSTNLTSTVASKRKKSHAGSSVAQSITTVSSASF